jgi:hypothetical protein
MQKPPEKGGFAPGHRSDRGDINKRILGLIFKIKAILMFNFARPVSIFSAGSGGCR